MATQHYAHHYYIGKKLSYEDTQRLLKYQSTILDENRDIIRDEDVRTCLEACKNNRGDRKQCFYVSFAYIGYITEEVAREIFTHLNQFLLTAASELPPTKCYYDKLSFLGYMKTYKDLGLTFKTETYKGKDVVTEVLVPYIAKFTRQYLKFCKPTWKPYVPLVRMGKKQQTTFKKRNRYEFDQTLKSIVFPEHEIPEGFFNLNSIDIIRGSPAEVKVGAKGLREDIIYEKLSSIPLSAKRNKLNIRVNNNRKNNNNLNNRLNNNNNLNNNLNNKNLNNNTNKNRLNNNSNNNNSNNNRLNKNNNNSNNKTNSNNNNSNKNNSKNRLNNNNSNNNNLNNNRLNKNNSDKKKGFLGLF